MNCAKRCCSIRVEKKKQLYDTLLHGAGSWSPLFHKFSFTNLLLPFSFPCSLSPLPQSGFPIDDEPQMNHIHHHQNNCLSCKIYDGNHWRKNVDLTLGTSLRSVSPIGSGGREDVFRVWIHIVVIHSYIVSSVPLPCTQILLYYYLSPIISFFIGYLLKFAPTCAVPYVLSWT